MLYSYLKNEQVAPPLTQPYLMVVCLARSSALSMVGPMRSIVRNAAKLAVYEAHMIKEKNHHMPAIILVDIPLKGQPF